jgi:hypothetical protein
VIHKGFRRPGVLVGDGCQVSEQHGGYPAIVV